LPIIDSMYQWAKIHMPNMPADKMGNCEEV
jgi:hypothetical protein